MRELAGGVAGEGDGEVRARDERRPDTAVTPSAWKTCAVTWRRRGVAHAARGGVRQHGRVIESPQAVPVLGLWTSSVNVAGVPMLIVRRTALLERSARSGPTIVIGGVVPGAPGRWR